MNRFDTIILSSTLISSVVIFFIYWLTNYVSCYGIHVNKLLAVTSRGIDSVVAPILVSVNENSA